MEDKPATSAIIKDPMRDSLLSSDYEVDSPPRGGSPVENSGLYLVPSTEDKYSGVEAWHETASRVVINGKLPSEQRSQDAPSRRVMMNGLLLPSDEDKHLTSSEENTHDPPSRVVVNGDVCWPVSSVSDSCLPDSSVVDTRWPVSSTGVPEQAWEGVGQCQDIYKDEECPRVRDDDATADLSSADDGQPDSLQQELEFDYWQGQFEFYSPALQDCPFVPANMFWRSADSVDGSGLPNGVLYKDLINTVKLLQGKVEHLGDTQSDSQERIVRVKQENSLLQARINTLEEQLRESEQRAGERLAEEQRRNRELIQRIEREKTLTVENYAIKQANLEQNNSRLEEEVTRLRAKTERHQKERHELEDRAVEAEVTASTSREEAKKAVAASRKEQMEEQERAHKAIEELRAEADRLKGALELTARTRQPSVDSSTGTSEQLILSLRAAKDENKCLQEQLEELQGQLLTKGLEAGRELVTSDNGNSLAAEFEAMTVDEADELDGQTIEQLKKTIRYLTEENEQFKKYIGGILDQILVRCPELLEVRPGAS